MLLLPPLFERLRLPGIVGLLLGGVLVGPYVSAIVPPDAPAVELFASVGRVFLMFIAGLEIDMQVFNATRRRSIGFGAMTFALPLLGGIFVALFFGFGWIAALLIGSLIASHTLLGFPIVNKLGLGKSEPVAVTVGATIFTDIASLLVLAVCISIYKGGFSLLGLGIQLAELAVFAVIILQGLPLLGRVYFHRYHKNEQALFVFTFLIVMIAAAGAHFIHLEDIVGAFLAGIAVNRLLERSPVRDQVIMIGESLFVPLFFLAIGVRLNLPVFGATLLNSLWFVVAITVALFAGKLLAVTATRWFYDYDWPATLTMWSLSLPQVAATLAAAIAAYETVNADGDRLITESVLNAVIVLMVLTAVLGPILTEHFGRRMLVENKE
ncbi:MAG: cation:proton antiporter [Gammaproteobacteria bacterium]|nr:cation:proton antiporter [Gammaproteobacteria bacterium]MCP5196379.1 cation:proton antiporter [Gammaproteobacteria bacterium]